MADRKITELSVADSTDISSSNAVLHLVNPDRVADADKNRKLALKSNVVLTSETQTVGGAKTFSSDVTVPNLVVGDGGNIGSASDTDAISIAAGGDVTISQDAIVTGDLDASNITVDDGGTIGSASDPDALSIASGGVVNFTQEPTVTGEDVYYQGNILGTVSQSGGTPTGAVIERGSNANGEYVKYADGTMICTKSFSSTRNQTQAAGSFVTTTADITWTYPVAFAASPAVSGIAGRVNNDVQYWGYVGYKAINTTNFVHRLFTPSGTGSVGVIHNLTAIGRWY